MYTYSYTYMHDILLCTWYSESQLILSKNAKYNTQPIIEICLQYGNLYL